MGGGHVCPCTCHSLCFTWEVASGFQLHYVAYYWGRVRPGEFNFSSCRFTWSSSRTVSTFQRTATYTQSWYITQHIFMTWDMRFSRRRVWRWLSSGLLRRVVGQKFTGVSEIRAASIIRAMIDDGGSKYLWNVGKLLPDYMVQQPRRQVIFMSLWSSIFIRNIVETVNTQRNLRASTSWIIAAWYLQYD
jgi:hypothetical protein